MDLKEISLVNFPADNDARISVVKSEIESINSLKEAEIFLRDLGFSKSSATAFVSRIKNQARRDTGSEFEDEITELNAQIQRKKATDSLVNFIKQL